MICKIDLCRVVRFLGSRFLGRLLDRGSETSLRALIPGFLNLTPANANGHASQFSTSPCTDVSRRSKKQSTFLCRRGSCRLPNLIGSHRVRHSSRAAAHEPRRRSRRDAQTASAGGRGAVEIVKRSDRASGFTVLLKPWTVERTIAWLNRCRRLAKDWENLNRKALAFLRLASIRLMLRKLCNPA